MKFGTYFALNKKKSCCIKIKCWQFNFMSETQLVFFLRLYDKRVIFWMLFASHWRKCVTRVFLEQAIEPSPILYYLELKVQAQSRTCYWVRCRYHAMPPNLQPCWWAGFSSKCTSTKQYLSLDGFSYSPMVFNHFSKSRESNGHISVVEDMWVCYKLSAQSQIHTCMCTHIHTRILKNMS